MIFEEISASDVDNGKHRASQEALGFARKDLKLPNFITVKWIIPANKNRFKAVRQLQRDEFDSDTCGFFLSNEPGNIFIRADLSDYEVRKTVLHETFHAALKYRSKGTPDSSDKSNISYDYEKDAVNRLYALSASELQEIFLLQVCGEDFSPKKPTVNTRKDTEAVKPSTPIIVHKTGYII